MACQKLIHSYLSNCVVSYDNNIARELEQSCPQGGILSPFLSLIMAQCIKIDDNSTIQAYADNVCVKITAKRVSMIEKVAKKVKV